VNILDRDSDGDGLIDGFETSIMTDPADPDTDGDGLIDSKDKNPTLNQDKNGNGIPDDLEDYLKDQSHDHTEDELDLENRTDTDDLLDVVFYVEPTTKPRYWRLRAYDNFDGRRWTMMEYHPKEYQWETLKPDVSVFKGREDVTYNIEYEGMAMGYLPTALHTTRVWDVEPERTLYRDVHDNFYTDGVTVESYNFSAPIYNYTNEQLMGAVLSQDPEMDPFLQLPENISRRVQALALELGQHGTTPYEKATYIADYLRENYRFNLNSQVPTEEESKDLVDWFLFEGREGRSEEFATVFVVLLRLNGIHSRVADGYAVGEIVDDRRVVTKGHAHNWGEVYLEGPGWLMMESTGTRVAAQGATGVNASGGDASVYQGGSPGTGGGTTKGEDQNDTFNLTVDAKINFRIDRYQVWKGDVFMVDGEVIGKGLPDVMDVKVRLSHEDGDIVDACDGASLDGAFLLVCSPDKAHVGPNRVLISAEGQLGDIRFTASNPNQPPLMDIFSNSTFKVDAPDSMSKYNTVDIKFELLDMGGVAYGNRTVGLEWGHRYWELKTGGSSTEFTLDPYDFIGETPLNLSFFGEEYLEATEWNKTIDVKNEITNIHMSILENKYVVHVGDSINVKVTLRSSNGTLINENVTIQIDNGTVAQGIANIETIPVNISPNKVGGGRRTISAFYAGSDLYPNATDSHTLSVIGTTRVLIGPKTVSVGKDVFITPMLVDNLNRPLKGTPMSAIWTYPSGEDKSIVELTDDGGRLSIPFRTVGELPGKVIMSIRFDGSQYYTGSSENTTITVTSPTVLMADMPDMLIRGLDFKIHGRLFNYKGDGIPEQKIKIYHNGTAEIGATTTMSDGSFMFEAKLLPSAPLGDILFNVRFQGTELLEAHENSSIVPVYAQPRIFVHGPDVVDIGKEFKVTVELMDDREIPLTNAMVNVTIEDTGMRQRTLTTDSLGKASIKLKGTGDSITLNVTYDGGDHLLSTFSLFIVKVSFWKLVSNISAIILSVIIVLAVTNLIIRRHQLKEAEEAIGWSTRVRARDKYRKMIFKVYRSTADMFAEKGLPRHDAQTVREYEVVANDFLGLDAKALSKVTGIFEEARYSDHILSKGHVKRVKQNYKRLSDALERRERG
jgi:transglutaminase-like putative cysteine protease